MGDWLAANLLWALLTLGCAGLCLYCIATGDARHAVAYALGAVAWGVLWRKATSIF